MSSPLLRDNPVYSYLRHWLTFQILKFAGDLQLGGEGLEPAVVWLAEAVLLLVAWLGIKYLIPWLTKAGFVDFFKQHTGLFLMLVAVSCMALLSGCRVLEDFRVSGVIRHEDSGAKVVLGDQTVVRIPITGDDGRVSGYVEVEAAK